MIDFRFQFGKFISCSDVGAIAAKREIIAVERNVMRITKGVANTIATFTRFDTFSIAVSDEAVWAYAAGVAQIGHRRTRMWVLVVLTAAFALFLVALFVDGAISAAIDCTVVFGTPACQVNCWKFIVTFDGHDAHRLTSASVGSVNFGYEFILEGTHAVAHDIHATENGLVQSCFIRSVTLGERILSVEI